MVAGKTPPVFPVGSDDDPLAFERTFRRRLIWGCTALLVLFGTATAFRYLEIGVRGMAFADFATIGIALGNLVLARSDRHVPLAGHVLTTSVLAVLILDNCSTGGFYDPNFGWMYVIPVVGGLLSSGRAAVGYGLVVAALTLGFFFADGSFPDLVPAADHASQSLFNRLTEIGALVGVVVAFSYERSRAAVALARAVTDATAGSRAKSEFLANMSHELRTPLTAIIGFSELLVEEAEDEQRTSAATDLSRIRTAARSLLDLINEVLDLSKIEAGRMEVVAGPTDLGSTLRELATTLGPLVRQGGNEWKVAIPDDFWVARIDGPRLVQILTNLVGNSAKFTRGGEVCLTASRGGGQLRVDVADTGIGIPADKHELVFGSFVQADSSTTRSFGGTGLGLAIARRLARLMGGDVVLTSTPGRGSVFTVTVAADG